MRVLHGSALLRRIAKRLGRGRTIQQPFHGGVICLDAVEHSWAWTGQHTYEKFDRSQQDAMLALSRDHPWLVDIGCNLGAMTLGILLRNPQARSVSVDPNPRAIQLLRQSLEVNRLTDRAHVFQAAIAPAGARVRFDFEGSVTGHVTEAGSSVATKSVAEVLAAVPAGVAALIKVDVEGFETQFLAELAPLARARGAVLVLELHSKGMNGWGDPAKAIALLRAEQAVITTLDGQPITEVEPSAIFQIVARWR
jgi:FkbM family methyltransferase